LRRLRFEPGSVWCCCCCCISHYSSPLS
jgi:hypothetical protein